MSLMPEHIELMRQNGMLRQVHKPDCGEVYVNLQIDLNEHTVNDEQLKELLSENIRKYLRQGIDKVENVLYNGQHIQEHSHIDVLAVYPLLARLGDM